MHHAGPLAGRNTSGQLSGEVVRAGYVAGPGPLQLLGPATHLPREKLVGVAELAESNRRRVHFIQVGQGVDQLMRQRCSLTIVKVGGILGMSQDRTLDVLHDIERCPDHARVLTQRHHCRNGHRGPRQGRHHPILTGHVVSRCQDVPEGRSTKHPVVGAVGDSVGQVGLAALEEVGPPRWSGSWRGGADPGAAMSEVLLNGAR